MRALRGPLSSFQVLGDLARTDDRLVPLFLEHPNARKLPFCLTPRLGEMAGVMHMKFLVFDDTVVITGANLSHTYFDNRLDRYLVIKNAPSLADYFESLVGVAESRVLERPGRFKDLVKTVCTTDHGLETGAEVWPSTQRMIYSDHESCPLALKLAKASAVIRATLMSAYLNMNSALLSLLRLHLGGTPLKIVTASSSSNGFAGATGAASAVPLIYEDLKAKFLRSKPQRPSLIRNASGHEIVHGYSRPGWTFHGKGLFLEYPDHFALAFGSSNFGTLHTRALPCVTP